MLSEKFWAKVDKSGDCWLWTGTVRHPYGMMNVKRDGKWTSTGAHRLAYELTYGHPGNKFVCHKCDVPLCVRPDHLFLGTHAENMHDMHHKGRGHSTVSKEQVVQARTLAAQDVELHVIASTIKADFQATVRAVRGETWSHLTEPPPVLEPQMVRTHKRTKLSLEDIAEIREALKNPYRGINNDLAAKYGCHYSAISHIRKGSYGTLSF